MADSSKLSPSQWIELLAEDELAAITSIAVVLDKFANDDISSIPKLSKVILHDQALSSCMLKVANSAIRSPRSRVTTVSRAAIVLGIQAVKNICLTAKVLDRLLKCQNLSPEVYDRLMKLMANAFYAGQLARIMVPEHDESTQEEVYLAAMMYHIGETAFWSTGLPLTETLIEKVDMPEADFQRHCASVIGVRFKDVSIGLAKRWNLGDLLIKALDHPESRAVEMNIISLANRITRDIAIGDTKRLEKSVKDMSLIMKIDEAKVRRRIESTREFAVEMLNSYGASVLTSYIKPLPGMTAQNNEEPVPVIAQLTTEQGVLAMTKEITQLVKAKANINTFLSTTLRNLSLVLDFEQCSFWALNKERNRLDCRITYDAKGQALMLSGSVAINKADNLFSMALQRDTETLLDKSKMNHVALSADIETIINRGPLCLFPIKLAERPIGLVCAQIISNHQKISSHQVAHLSFVLDHLNLCLTLVSQRQ